MARMSAIGVLITILIASTASWNVFHKSQSEIAQDTFKQGFLKGVVIPQNSYLHAAIVIDDYRLKTDIAGTSQQQQTGLAIKSALKENEAMLFPFATESVQGFWMKDMKFPIDILWIDKNNTIVYVEPNLQPCINIQNCPIYQPNVKIIYVLETVAGFAQHHNIKVGQTKISAELLS